MAAGDRGTEVFLSLVDLGFRPSGPAGSVLEVQTTCLNRDLPQDLPFGGDQPRLQFARGRRAGLRIRCLTPPTRTFRPGLGHGLLWRLISHLSLNHLSLVENGNADALREILKLYDFADSAETRSQIDGILGVSSRRIVASDSERGAVDLLPGNRGHHPVRRGSIHRQRPVPLRQRAGAVPGACTAPSIRSRN